MGKKVYVNGSIVVNTRYFVPQDIGVGYPDPPEGAIVVEPEDEVEGVKCLLIDDNHPNPYSMSIMQKVLFLQIQ